MLRGFAGETAEHDELDAGRRGDLRRDGVHCNPHRLAVGKTVDAGQDRRTIDGCKPVLF